MIVSSGNNEEDMNYFAPVGGCDGEEEDDVFDMPCFEASNNDDRPFAPSAEDYPIGCDVELRDIEFAKIAQEAAHWEPFFDTVFSTPRRLVKVCRHLGDYTFVTCTDVEGFERVCFTLYRACLTEPKVKTTKYFANALSRGEEGEDRAQGTFNGVDNASSGSTSTSTSTSDDEEGLFEHPVMQAIPVALDTAAGAVAARASAAPPTSTALDHSHPMKAVPPNPVTVAGLSAEMMGDAPFGVVAALQGVTDDVDRPPFVFPGDIATQQPQAASATGFASSGSSRRGGRGADLPPSRPPGSSHPPPASGVDTKLDNGHPRTPRPNTPPVVDDSQSKRRFVAAMKGGTRALKAKKYEKALRYYNIALEACPQEKQRVLSSRSVAYMLLCKTDDALNDAKEVIEMSPNDFLGYVRAANVLRGLKMYYDAHGYYKQAQKRAPDNSVIRRLLLGNFVTMLYEARTRHYPLFKIVFNESDTRIEAVAKDDVKAKTMVLKEVTSLGCPFSVQYHSLLEGNRAARMCCHCMRPLVQEEDLRQSIPELTTDVFHALYTEAGAVQCNKTCGVAYCSTECRSKAWAEHHWVECSAAGRWKEGLKAMHLYVDEYISAHCTTGEDRSFITLCDKVMLSPARPLPEVAVSGINSDHQLSPAEDTSAHVRGSCVRIASRMVARMLTCVWNLPDAVHMYDWLHVAPIVESQRVESNELLRGAFEKLARSFNNDEKQEITFKVFERCYERAKSNASRMTVSAWEKIQMRAESQSALQDTGTSSVTQSAAAESVALPAIRLHTPTPPNTQPPHPPIAARLAPSPPKLPTTASSASTGAATAADVVASSSSTVSVAKAPSEVLRKVLEAPSYGLPGTFYHCLVVFELVAVTAPINDARYWRQLRQSSRSKGHTALAVPPPPLRPNVVVQSTVEPLACIRLCATEDIKKGRPFVLGSGVQKVV